MLYYCGNQWGYTPLGGNLNIPSDYCFAPTNLTTSVENQYVTFRWTAPHDYSRFILEYRVQGSGGLYTIHDVYGISFKAELTGSTVYEWRVRTVCDPDPFRASSYTNGIVFTTGTSIASCTPIGNVTVTNQATYYLASWTNTNALYYVVQVRLQNTTTIFEYVTQETSFQLNDLQVGFKYDIRVVSVCSPTVKSESPWVEVIVVRLNCPKPGNINTSISATSILASWFPPVGSIGEVFTYNVYLNTVLIISDFPHTSFSFSNLTPDTSYQIDVRTNCSSGYSVAATTTVKTKLATCPEATALVLTLLSNSSIQADWTPASGIASQQVILNNGTAIPLAASANTYSFTNLPGGSINNVIIRSVCSGIPSQGISKSIQLTGCQPATDLTFTTNYDRITAKWKGPINANYYRFKITRVVDSTVIYQGLVYNTEYTVNGLSADEEYSFEIIAVCGITDATALTGSNTTSAVPVCESAVIDAITYTQSTVLITYHFASGIVNGFIKTKLVSTVDAGVLEKEQASVEPVLFEQLTPGVAYNLFIYLDNGICSSTVIQTITQPAACNPPTGVIASLNSTNTSLTISATAAVPIPTSYELEYTSDDSNWSSAGTVTFPHTINSLTPGRYKVRIRSNCSGLLSDWVYSEYACPKPLNVQAFISATKATVSWDSLANALFYRVELTSLLGGVKTFETTTNSFIVIENLDYTTAYSVSVTSICKIDPEVATSSDTISFSTGAQEPDNTNNCQPATFLASIQDCSLTDPTTGNPDTNQCTVAEGDWDIDIQFITVIDETPFDRFIEVGFSIEDNTPVDEDALIPGGIMGIVSAACRPNSSTTLELIFGPNSTIITGSAVLGTNGEITASASYTKTVEGKLFVRVRGKYTKA